MSSIKIGKNAIENLTRGMYQDSRIIYREYIQNAADQTIDDEELVIDITIDRIGRNIKIRDNGTGVEKALIEKKLAYVADSEKEFGESAGFRGIGRLGGLAYCDKLRFITTAKGENIKSTMEWDAKTLNQMLDDRTVKDDASTILQKIISYGKEEECSVEEHYFVVELLGIKEDNMDLLDSERIKEYIALNAPVPFGDKFHYKKDIYDYLQSKGFPRHEYKIFVDGEDICKLYTTTLSERVSEKQSRKYDDIYGIEIKEFFNSSGEMLAWMWYGISRFEKQIPFPLNETAGIRLRQSNIQIGNERTLVPLFKEVRANLYFIGEVHAVHKGLTPNARRDYFNENSIRNELEAELKFYFSTKLHSLYTDANKAKIDYKKELDLLKKEKEYKEKQGRFVNEKAKHKIVVEIEEAQKRDGQAKREIERLKNKAEADDVFRIVLEHIEKNHVKALQEAGFDCKGTNKNQVNEITDERIDNHKNKRKKDGYLVSELTHLPDKQKKLVARIYDVIIQNLPPEKSEELIGKIQEELKHGKKDSAN